MAFLQAQAPAQGTPLHSGVGWQTDHSQRLLQTASGPLAQPPQDCRIDHSLANRLLAQLSLDERRRVLSQAQWVELEEAAVLVQAGQALAHAYFPTDCLISLLTHRVQPRSFEVGQLGYEGMLGAAAALGVSASAFDAVVTGAGRAWQIELPRLRALCRASRPLSLMMTRFLYFELSQMGALAACAHFHTLEQRLARFLLMSMDRLRVADLKITHEALSLILGVRRASVTLAAGAFQDQGWIQYSRGHMLILSRAGLLQAVCACYAQDLLTYEQVVLEPTAAQRAVPSR